MSKRFGFTLAEVLIVLAVIGVIAALTIPTLMNRTQGMERRVAFKKAFSVVNQAVDLAVAKGTITDGATKEGVCKGLKANAKIATENVAWSGAGNAAVCDYTLADSSRIAIASGKGIEIWVQPGTATPGTCTPVAGGASTTWGNCFKVAITSNGLLPALDANTDGTTADTAGASTAAKALGDS